MSLPLVVLFAGFLLLIGFPAVVHVVIGIWDCREFTNSEAPPAGNPRIRVPDRGVRVPGFWNWRCRGRAIFGRRRLPRGSGEGVW
jgi:hypothetical protein